MITITSPGFREAFRKYPENVFPKLQRLRELVHEAGESIEPTITIEESLKWGEPTFLTKNGSTIRIDWKVKKADQYAIYFNCHSQLIPVFRLLFNNVFTFEGNRAIILDLDEKIPETELKIIFTAALTYHKIKHLPKLGI